MVGITGGVVDSKVWIAGRNTYVLTLPIVTREKYLLKRGDLVTFEIKEVYGLAEDGTYYKKTTPLTKGTEVKK